jgi:MFS family permease
MPITSRGPSDRAVLLRNKPVMLFWFARVSSTIAYQMLAVAVGWQIYALTHSPFYLGLVGLAQFLPMFLLTLVVGHVADRYDRRLILRICQFIEGVGTLALAVGSYSGWVTKEGILVIVFVLGAARAFENPTLHSLLPTWSPPNSCRAPSLWLHHRARPQPSWDRRLAGSSTLRIRLPPMLQSGYSSWERACSSLSSGSSGRPQNAIR